MSITVEYLYDNLIKFIKSQVIVLEFVENEAKKEVTNKEDGNIVITRKRKFIRDILLYRNLTVQLISGIVMTNLEITKNNERLHKLNYEILAYTIERGIMADYMLGIINDNTLKRIKNLTDILEFDNEFIDYTFLFNNLLELSQSLKVDMDKIVTKVESSNLY